MRIGARCKRALTAFPDKCRGRIEQMDWKGSELVSEPPAGFKKGADRINSIRMHPTEADAYFMLPCAEKTAAPGWGGPCSAICFLEVRMAQVKEQNPAPAQNRASDNSGEKRPRTRRPYYSCLLYTSPSPRDTR